MTGFYHLCFVVPDLTRAMGELERGLGVQWNAASSGTLESWDYEIVFSRQGPPFFELIKGPPGSPWDASTGPRCDHIGYWSADVKQGRDALAERGLAVDFDACPLGRAFTYHRLDSLGIRVELVDQSSQPSFLKTWAPTSPPMPSLDLTHPTRREIMPDPITNPSDAAECRAVLIELLAAIDHGRATEALGLFTDDASLTARGEQLQGLEAISSFLAQRQAETHRQTVHVIANEIIQQTDDQLLELRATLVLHVRQPDNSYLIERVLESTQTFRATNVGWRISQRDVWPLHA